MSLEQEGRPGPPPTFEAAVERLEALVKEMEDGSLTLEGCLERFEEAVALSRFCAAKLDAAERRIHILGANGQLLPHEEDAWQEGDGGARPPED